MAKVKNPSRRRFLIVSGALIGGGLLIGYTLRDRDRLARVGSFVKKDDEVALNAWVKITPDGAITVAVPHQEMGQGVYTSLPMLVAEEMDADWSKIGVEQAPIDKIYGNYVILGDGLPVDPEDKGTVATVVRWVGFKIGEGLGILATGGSTSIRDAWEPMRIAGASAREMLVHAAASRWKVAVAECATANSVVIHKASGRKLGYGELAEAVSRMAPPRAPRLKQRKDYKLIGKSTPRLDIHAKVTGTAEFGIDVRLPGMLYAAVAQSPVFGGKLERFDDTAVKSMPGVQAVVAIPDGVAVVANSYWRAKSALAKLPVVWNDGPNATLDSSAVFTQFEHDLEHGSAVKYRADGDAVGAIDKAAKTIEARYQVPFLAHATMEPMNCTALIKDGKCEVWAPNQSPSLVKWMAGRVADIDGDDVTVHTTFLGGGFGRRAENDFVIQAVTLAKAVPGKPVKVIWSREEDIQHDVYRPAAMAAFRGGLDGAGKPLGLWNRIVGPSVTRDFMDRLLPFGGMDYPPDKTNAEGAAELPYEFPNLRVEHVLSKTPIPVGFWRSVGHSYNAFFTECFMDEMAAAANADPYEFRRRLLARHPRFRIVLETAATRAGWGKPLKRGMGRGIALHQSFRSIVAQVAEVSVTHDGAIKVQRVVCAIDCGMAVNPDTIVAQMESGIVFGLSAALYGEITIDKGRVQQNNFPNYEMVRLAQAPDIEVHVVESAAAIGGVGEPGTPPIAPAVANAVFAATGKRVRRLPIRAADISRV